MVPWPLSRWSFSARWTRPRAGGASSRWRRWAGSFCMSSGRNLVAAHSDATGGGRRGPHRGVRVGMVAGGDGSGVNESAAPIGIGGGTLGDWCVDAGLGPAERSAGTRSRKCDRSKTRDRRRWFVWKEAATFGRRRSGRRLRAAARGCRRVRRRGRSCAGRDRRRQWVFGSGGAASGRGTRFGAPRRVGFVWGSRRRPLVVVGAVSSRVDRTRRGCRGRLLGRAAGFGSPRWREGAACVGRGLPVDGVRAVGCGMWPFFGPRVRSRHGEEAPAFAPGAEGFIGRGYAS